MNYADFLYMKTMAEASEVIQDTEKLAMFGPDSCNPDTGVRNDDKLSHEIHDFLAMIEMLQENGLFTFVYDRKKIEAKKRKVVHHAKVINILPGDITYEDIQLALAAPAGSIEKIWPYPVDLEGFSMASSDERTGG